MSLVRRSTSLGNPLLLPYLISHSDALRSARQMAERLHAREIRTFEDWGAEHDVSVLDGNLGAYCLGLAVVLEGRYGIALSTILETTRWRNCGGWHELGHLLTGTARAVACKPDQWLSSRVERLAWCAASIYAVSAFEAVQIGWRVVDVETISEQLDLPVELVELRVALAIRDREIPMLRMNGGLLVETALQQIAAASEWLCRRAASA